MKDEAKILITSSTKNLSLLRDFIEAIAHKIKLDDNVINQIVLSVDEACTNIIKHAHKYDEARNIEVTVDANEKEFSVTFDYKGVHGFDPNNSSNPDMQEYFKNYKVGGLGIPIMKKFMNKIVAKHVSPDLNTLILVKSLNGTAPVSANAVS